MTPTLPHAPCRVAPDRLQDGPVKPRGRRVTPFRVPGAAATNGFQCDLWRKGARKGERMGRGEVEIGSTKGIDGLHLYEAESAPAV